VKLTADESTCSICQTPLPNPRSTYGDHNWPLCWDCKWFCEDEAEADRRYRIDMYAEHAKRENA
jgi:hypothetical protein